MKSGYSATQVMLGLTNMQARQHASGARVGEERAIGKSVGGLTTKIHITADAHGNPISFEITGGEVHDCQKAPEMIAKLSEKTENFIADRGDDSELIGELARKKGINPVIPRRSKSVKSNTAFDKHLYKQRHLVEKVFARLKQFRSLSSRFDELARNFKAMVFLGCTFI